MSKSPKKTEAENIVEADIKRGHAVLKRMLQSKPKPHKDMVGKKKRAASPTRSASRRGAK